MIKSIGHENNKLKLKKILKSNSIGHAYLFVGKKSIGKKLVAIEFAKSILCSSNVEGEYCNKCEPCLTFENNSDFKIITPVKEVIKVDVIRELSNELYLMPTTSKRKVFIIDDADFMNEQAQNALLKILEEPPTYATIILISSNKEKLLNTIKSRVIEFQFDNLKKEELKSIIGDNLTDEAIMFSNGSVSKAIDFMNDESFEIAKEVSKLLIEKDFLKINRKFEEIKSDKTLKSNISNILEKVMYIFHNRLKSDISFEIKLIEDIENTLQNIKRNANVDLALDLLMINICKM